MNGEFGGRVGRLASILLLTACIGCGVTPPEVVKPKAISNPQQVVAAQGYPVAQATYTSAPLPLPVASLPAIKPLVDRTEQEAAMDALGRIGPPAVPALVEALASPDAQVRLAAAQTLARMGPDAKDAVPALLPLLDDPDERIRKAATRSLGRIGPEAAAAIPALMRALEEQGTAPTAP